MSGLVVKSHRPQKARALLVLGVMVVILAGWSLWEYGRYRGGFDRIQAERDFRDLHAIQSDLEAQLFQLRERNAVLERTLQVQREASAEVKVSLQALQAEIAALNEELAFYRGIVSPQDASRGLRLQSFKLTPLASDGSYRYKLVLTQVLKNDRVVKGAVQLRFEGTKAGRPQVLELDDVTEKGVKVLNYRFKYFQDFRGTVRLPAEFQLKRVAVQVRPQGRSTDVIEKTFEWKTKEQAIHVGKHEKAEAVSKD